MTKLFISADLEGVCGVTSPLQCSATADRSAYDWAVHQLALEVNTVAEAALEAGVQQVIVNDSHYTMANLLPKHLNPRVSLLSGKPKTCAMSAGLDSICDAALYIGYHAKAGTQNGILCHTFHSKLFDVSVNGVSYGEGGINALYASLVHQVPVILASGDQAFCQEITGLIPRLATVRTKTSLSCTAALSRPLEEVLEDYRVKVAHLLADSAAWTDNLLTLAAPYELRITFINTLAADVAMTLPWLTRVDGRTVQFTTDHFQTLYQTLQSAYSLLGYTAYMGHDF